MGRRSSICSHPQRGEIEAALVVGETLRKISEDFGISITALHRHKTEHLAEGLKRGAELAEQKRASLTSSIAAKAAEHQVEEEARSDARSIKVYEQLGLMFERIGKAFDACDRFLTDPADPGTYNLCPRAHELEVIHQVVVGVRKNGTEIVETQRHLLSELLPTIPGERLGDVIEVKWKVADPRMLLLSVSKRLESQQKWLADLLVKMQEQDGRDLARTPEWIALRNKLANAIEGCERCTSRVASALSN